MMKPLKPRLPRASSLLPIMVTSMIMKTDTDHGGAGPTMEMDMNMNLALGLGHGHGGDWSRMKNRVWSMEHGAWSMEYRVSRIEYRVSEYQGSSIKLKNTSQPGEGKGEKDENGENGENGEKGKRSKGAKGSKGSKGSYGWNGSMGGMIRRRNKGRLGGRLGRLPYSGFPPRPNLPGALPARVTKSTPVRVRDLIHARKTLIHPKSPSLRLSYYAIRWSR